MRYKKTFFLLSAIAALFFSSFTIDSHPQGIMSVSKIVQRKDSVNILLVPIDSLELMGNLIFLPFKQKAHASYYADRFNGKRTASGKKFNNNKYTAAHRKFAFGTKLRITNEENGKCVLVEVTDRGPFTKGREIDLSKKAFMDIAHNKKSGGMNVKIEIIK